MLTLIHINEQPLDKQFDIIQKIIKILYNLKYCLHTMAYYGTPNNTHRVKDGWNFKQLRIDDGNI